jgi:cell division protein FtsA
VAPGREVLHVLPQRYYIDGQGGIRDPVGIAGVRLEVDVHLVTGAATAVQNIRHSIVRAGWDVRDLVLEPLAASCAVLSDDEREMGVCLIDIGGGTTNVALFADSCIHHTSVIGLGGQNATNDLAVGLRTSWSLAEQIKCESGTALPAQVADGELVEVPGIAGRPPKGVPRHQVASIIGARMEEILGLVQANLRASGFSRPPGAGVVLTGGGALVPGIADLAEQHFRVSPAASAACPTGSPPRAGRRLSAWCATV